MSDGGDIKRQYEDLTDAEVQEVSNYIRWIMFFGSLSLICFGIMFIMLLFAEPIGAFAFFMLTLFSFNLTTYYNSQINGILKK